MTTPSQTQEDFVRRLLTFETRAATTVEERAEAAATLFEKTFGALAPVIGADGVDAIFKRSVRLTRQAFPCLELVSSPGEPLDPRQCLRGCQRDGDSAHFFKVAIALYARFFASIATLIGERLGSQIIQTAWPDMAQSNTETEETKG